MKNKYYYFDKLTKKWSYLGNLYETKKYLQNGIFFDKTENKLNVFYLKYESYDFLDESFGRFVFCDEDFNIVDMNPYKKEIIRDFKCYEDSYIYYNYKRSHLHDNNFKYGDLIKRRYRLNNVYYRFRIDPIPHTNICYHRKIKGPKYRRIISAYLNPEKKEFIRIKHFGGLIRDAYDYEYFNNRCIQKSWKEKKIKHQWEKNL